MRGEGSERVGSRGEGRLLAWVLLLLLLLLVSAAVGPVFVVIVFAARAKGIAQWAWYQNGRGGHCGDVAETLVSVAGG
jgi:hypothetical protein